MSKESKSKNRGSYPGEYNCKNGCGNSGSGLGLGYNGCYPGPCGRSGGCGRGNGSMYCYNQLMQQGLQPGLQQGCPPPGIPGYGGYQCLHLPETYPSQAPPSFSSNESLYARQRALCHDDPCDRPGLDGRVPNAVGFSPPSYDCQRRDILQNHPMGYSNLNATHNFDSQPPPPLRGKTKTHKKQKNVIDHSHESRNYEFGNYDCPGCACQRHRY